MKAERKIRMLLFVSMATLAAAGCFPILDGTICTDDFRAGVNVTVTDENGDPISGATLTLTEGDFSETMEESSRAGEYFGAGERAGAYTLTVEAVGFEPVVVDDIVVDEDECHVIPVAQEVSLTPSRGRTGEALEQLLDDLSAGGSVVEVGDTISQPFFTVQGQVIIVDGSDVQVFEYGSSEAAEEEAGLVAPDGNSVGTTMILWVATPHFYKSGTLIVLYVGDDAAVTDSLEAVLGPQFAGGPSSCASDADCCAAVDCEAEADNTVRAGCCDPLCDRTCIDGECFTVCE